jgi:hypothetical protein
MLAMTSPMIPPKYQTKVEELRKHLQAQKPQLVVRAGFDFRPRGVSFPFDEGPKLKHLLRVTEDLLQDCSTDEIIQRLESAKWEQVLDELPSNQIAILTTQGFKFTALST